MTPMPPLLPWASRACLIDDIQAELVAQGVEALIVGVVGGAYAVKVEVPHELNVTTAAVASVSFGVR